jgi:hypothetical protein
MVMARSGSTCLNVREIDVQDRTHTKIPLAWHALKYRAGNIEFLHEFAYERVRLALARLYFAARELPFAFDKDRSATLRDEHTISVHDDACDHHSEFHNKTLSGTTDLHALIGVDRRPADGGLRRP